MFILKPDLFVKKITDINEIDFKKLDIKNLFLDVDDTIVPNNIEDMSKDILAWFSKIKQFLEEVAIVSNNSSQERVRYFARKLNVPYIYGAKKPFPFGLNRAINLVGASRQKSAIVGDQLFTDILGARICGIKAILVEPMSIDKSLSVRLKRRIEFYIKKKFEYSDTKIT